jgi:predicted nucleic acid-binding protein
VIYLDTSAAMKLVRAESFSHDLSAWLHRRADASIFSSVLIEIELIRATRRSAPDLLDRAGEVLRGIGVVTLSPAVVARAAGYVDQNLRSVDAIHLATAEHVATVSGQPLDSFVAYDDRLLGAAREVGLPTASPGVATKAW